MERFLSIILGVHLKQDGKVNAACENLGQTAERIEEQRTEFFLFKAFFERARKVVVKKIFAKGANFLFLFKAVF